MVERCGVGSIYPRVLEHDRRGPVFDDRGESSAGEEGFVEGHVEHVGQPRVDVDAPVVSTQ